MYVECFEPPIFDKIVFTLYWSIYAVYFISTVIWRSNDVVFFCRNILCFAPAEIMGFYIRIEIGGGDAVVVPAARCHDVPFACTFIFSFCAVIGVVIIHRSQSMSHFMAVGAYARNTCTAISPQFGCAGILVYFHILYGNGRESHLVRPYRVSRCTCFFTMSGKNNVYVIYVSISVGIVLWEIFFFGGIFYGFSEKCIRIYIISSCAGVWSVITYIVSGGVRTCEVANEIQLSVWCIVEKIMYASHCPIGRISLFIEQGIKFPVCFYKREIGKLHENDQCPTISCNCFCRRIFIVSKRWAYCIFSNGYVFFDGGKKCFQMIFGVR